MAELLLLEVFAPADAGAATARSRSAANGMVTNLRITFPLDRLVAGAVAGRTSGSSVTAETRYRSACFGSVAVGLPTGPGVSQPARSERQDPLVDLGRASIEVQCSAREPRSWAHRERVR